MASFFLGDLNDYLKPEAVCVIPEKSPDSNKEVKINLNDCLACSGCITSAESILVSQQTHEAVRQRCRQRPSNSKVVASLSPFSRAAIADHFKISLAAAQTAVFNYLFQVLHIDVFIDTGFCQGVALEQTVIEFFKRTQALGICINCPDPNFFTSCADFKTSIKVSEKLEARPDEEIPELDANFCPVQDRIPMMIGSECPGWICYAEKRYHHLLPAQSRVRSPQQICGAIVKKMLYPKSISEEKLDVFHFSIMPCHDKKLEASRSAYFGDDVDAVITTGELIRMMNDDFHSLQTFEKNVTLENSGSKISVNILSENQLDDIGDQRPVGKNEKDDKIPLTDGFNDHIKQFSYDRSQLLMKSERNPFPTLTPCGQGVYGTNGAGGGYIDYIISRIGPENQVRVNLVRTLDYTEYTINNDFGLELRFAKIYGFRNIQTMLQRIQRDSAKFYHFVEVMACPGACLLGGGQPSPIIGSESIASLSKKEHRTRLENLFNGEETFKRPVDQDPNVMTVKNWILEDPKTRTLQTIKTSFDAVLASGPITSLQVQW